MIDKETPVDTAELRRLLENWNKERSRKHAGRSVSTGGPVRRITGWITMNGAALLDEIDALRAKLAESEAANKALIALNVADQAKRQESAVACAMLAKAFSARLDKGTECQHRIAGPGGLYACQPCLDALNADIQLVLDLPASVRAHMEEDAALREVAKAAKRQCEIYEAALQSSWPLNSQPDPNEHYEDVLKPAIAAWDAVRAKGGD